MNLVVWLAKPPAYMAISLKIIKIILMLLLLKYQQYIITVYKRIYILIVTVFCDILTKFPTFQYVYYDGY